MEAFTKWMGRQSEYYQFEPECLEALRAALVPGDKVHGLFAYTCVIEHADGTRVEFQRRPSKKKSTDPATWCSWADVQAAYDRGQFDGVGFVLNGDGLVGIDLNHVLSDGQIVDHKDAGEYIAMLDKLYRDQSIR